MVAFKKREEEKRKKLEEERKKKELEDMMNDPKKAAELARKKKEEEDLAKTEFIPMFTEMIEKPPLTEEQLEEDVEFARELDGMPPFE